MAQYIDKDMLLKAIEVKRNGLIALMNQIPYASNYPIWSSNVDLLDEVKRGIGILEVKEVDLEKENSMKQEQTEFPGYNKALLEVKSKVDELYEEASIGLNEYDSGLYNGIAETCMKLRGFIKARLNSDDNKICTNKTIQNV